MNKKTIALIPLLIISVVMSCFVGCAKKTITVKIEDMLTESIVEIAEGSTVEQAIKEAEITIYDKDEISPANDKALADGDVITISRYAAVTLTNGKNTQELSLVGGTVSDAIIQAGITLTGKDAVNYDLNAYLTDGMNISITRLVTVTLTVDGKTKEINTSACIVSDFLTEQGVTLGDEDIVSLPLDKEMTSDTKLTVKRVETKTVTENQTIEFNTVYKSSSDMKKGESKVTQQGKNGEKTVKLSITYIDGKESERKVLEEKIISEPVDKIVLQGTKSTEKTTTKKSGKTIISKQRVDDCDGSGHGYFVITWSDGSVTYEEY